MDAAKFVTSFRIKALKTQWPSELSKWHSDSLSLGLLSSE